MNEDLELYQAFFKQDSTYYTERYLRYRTNEKFTFNIFAFLFGIFWFAYRKLYLELLVFVVLIIVDGFVENLIFPEEMASTTGSIIGFIITIAAATACGFFGNYRYFKKAERLVAVSKLRFEDDADRIAFLRKKGGRNYLMLIVLAILLGAIIIYSIYANPIGE